MNRKLGTDTIFQTLFLSFFEKIVSVPNFVRFVAILLTIITIPAMAFSEQKIKQPNVSGQFYESDPKALSAQVDRFMSQADVQPAAQFVDIVIAPHAGYVFSGGVAAYGFKAVSQNHYKTIVILAPSHFYGFDGISVWEEGGFQTPLGVAEVDREFAKKLTQSSPQFYFEPKAFEQEHSLEVEIPFLQKTFKDFRIVPVIMGQSSIQTLQNFAASLNTIIGDRKDVLIVVSTDLSHYHDDAFARAMDQHTIEAIEGLDVERIWREHHEKTMEMCGFIPVTTALLYAKLKGLSSVEVLHYANSGDVSGDKKRVVGYTSIIISNGTKASLAEEASLTLEQKKELIKIAKESVKEYVGKGNIAEFKVTDPRLLKEEGVFVSIYKKGRLRGCIGNIIGKGPLCVTVRNMAIAAATQDQRFTPVKENELDDLEIEVSVLSKPRVIKNVDEIELGVHGVIVSRDGRSGVFLPQVADKGSWTKESFLGELCSQKAGLPRDCWKDPKTKIEIYTAEVFSEKDVQ